MLEFAVAEVLQPLHGVVRFQDFRGVERIAVGVENVQANAPGLCLLLRKGCSGAGGAETKMLFCVLLANSLSPARQGVVPAPTQISLVVWFLDTICARSLVSEHLLSILLFFRWEEKPFRAPFRGRGRPVSLEGKER